METLIAWGSSRFYLDRHSWCYRCRLENWRPSGLRGRYSRRGHLPHHYLPFGRYSYPTDNGSFAKQFRRIGTTWTLDAFFRDTREEIRDYQKEGVLTVEMESSALFAVGQVRGVRVGAGFVISDTLYGQGWDPQFLQEPVEQGLDQLFELATQ